MAVFRCLQSGQTVEFILPHDINSMAGHAGYIRIDEPENSGDNSEEHQLIMRPPEEQKRPGRPRKLDNA
jgi:hypothetical protein